MKPPITRRGIPAGMGAPAAGAFLAPVIDGTLQGQPPLEKASDGRRSRPRVVAFDVIETLFDTAPLEPVLAELGLPAGSLKFWFAGLLRDAFALESMADFKPFKDVAVGSLHALLVAHGLEEKRTGIPRVLQAFTTLPAHPEAKEAFGLLGKAKVGIVTLTNGSAASTEAMLKGAGLRGFVERVISIEEVNHWKPSREVYLHAAKSMGVTPREMALVAAHDWDVGGAAKAGLTAAGIVREGKAFSGAMHGPHISGKSLVEVVQALLALPAS